MAKDFSQLSETERIKAENDYLKMKLMLENGAEFASSGNEMLDPEMENQFLNNVIAFEKQFEDRKTIKVYDKIGRPQQFKPANEIPESDIGNAWHALLDYLNQHSIDLGVCSPNISDRELYRFTLEELFEQEMNDIDIEGWTTNFIYDEFHPDPVYESSKAVEQYLFPALFSADPIGEHFYCIHDKGVQVNGRSFLNMEDAKAMINRFKSFYSHIELQYTEVRNCEVINTGKTIVLGNYRAVARTMDARDDSIFEGDFAVELEPDDLGYWSITKIEIKGLNFE